MASLANDVCSLSSSKDYYYNLNAWYEALKATLAKHGCEPEPMPPVHTHKGKAFIDFSGRFEGSVFFTWYRMPSSNWEVVCYKI